MTYKIWIVSFYAEGERIAGDCMPEFFPTKESAINAAKDFIAECNAHRANGSYDPVIDWPVRFTVRGDRVSEREWRTMIGGI